MTNGIRLLISNKVVTFVPMGIGTRAELDDVAHVDRIVYSGVQYAIRVTRAREERFEDQ